ncbi:hypothetical protein IMZ48_33805 [Candidatus Bathyarchaeota archaeon]|nr:hypothetical protein [Candidatus Bathyarchaeota archaeon]
MHHTDKCPGPPQILQETLAQLTKILKSAGARKLPIFIKSRDEVIDVAGQMVSPRVCPIFQVSPAFTFRNPSGGDETDRLTCLPSRSATSRV